MATINQLKIFEQVAIRESITETANALNIAQPSISRTIQSIEEEYQLELFERSGRNLVLNTNGKHLLTYVQKVIRSFESFESEALKITHQEETKIKLHINVMTGYISDIIYTFQEKYPMALVSTEITDTQTSDFVVYASSRKIIEHNSILLVKEKLLLAIPVCHPLSAKNSVKLCDFKNEFFIIYSRSNLSELTHTMCLNAGFFPNIKYSSEHVFVVKDLISKGLGVSLVPRISWHDFKGTNVILKEIDDINNYRYIYLQTKKSNLSAIEEAFKNHIIDFFASLD